MSETAENAATDLVVSTEGFVRVLRLNRPDRRNALSATLRDTLSEALLNADEDDAVRAVVITGTGPHAFCAGADLKDMRQRDAAQQTFRSPMGGTHRSAFEICYEMKKPTIAALNGSAVAGGFELALACDLRVAHPGVQLGLPEAKIGMGANFGSVVLPRRMSPTLALELLMTGDYVTGEQAFAYGLLNRLVPEAEVMRESMTLASKIADNAPLSVRRMKAMVTRGLDLPVAAALRLEPGPSPYHSEDRKEGIKARLEKRKPVWVGR